MKRVICVLLLLFLSGCEMVPFARELETTMLVQVLGVDWTEHGVALTAVSDPGTGGADPKNTVLSARGATIEAAQAALKGAGEESVSLTHVTQLVLGADTQVSAVLDAALQEPALSQTATVWLAAEGNAKELLEGAGGGAKRLSSIQLNSGVESVTVLHALVQLEEEGRTDLPVLALEGETLVPVGIKRIKGEVSET